MISKLIIPKDQLICIPENLNSQDALTILEDQQLRCAPVVDESTNLFRGNIYRYHFYYELYQQSLDNLSEIPVTRFLKNTTRVVHETDSFYHLLFTIRDLPHIAVLNEQNSFLGIIKHRTMLDFYSQAWQLNQSRYLLVVSGKNVLEDLNRLTRTVNRYTPINSLISYHDNEYDLDQHLFFLLPMEFDQLNLNTVIHTIQRKGYQADYYLMN